MGKLVGAARGFWDRSRRHVVETIDDSAAPFWLTGQHRYGQTPAADVDRNSLKPFSRALLHYGMTPEGVEGVVRSYLDRHPVSASPGQSAAESLRRLLGIRAANIMAQILAANEPYTRRNAPGEEYFAVSYEEQITNKDQWKRFLILAALLHRTPSTPTERWIEPDEASRSLRADFPLWGSTGENLGELVTFVVPLIKAAGFMPSNMHVGADADFTSELNRIFGIDAYGLQSRQAKFGSLMQLATRAALFADGPGMADEMVVWFARERQGSSAQRALGLSDLAWVAYREAYDVLTENMPLNGPGHSFYRPTSSTLWNNIRACVARYQNLATAAVNQGRVSVTFVQ